MGRAINSAEYRLMVNFHTTNDCPYEANNLNISNKLCQKRFKASEKARIEAISRGGLFTCMAGQGGLRCKSCPVVRELPEFLEAPLSHISQT